MPEIADTLVIVAADVHAAQAALTCVDAYCDVAELAALEADLRKARGWLDSALKGARRARAMRQRRREGDLSIG